MSSTSYMASAIRFT